MRRNEHKLSDNCGKCSAKWWSWYYVVLMLGVSGFRNLLERLLAYQKKFNTTPVIEFSMVCIIASE